MKLQTRLYFQKTGILMAVYLVLRFLLPIVLPFFLAWVTVGCLTFFQKRSHMKLMSLSVLYLVLFLLLSVAGSFFNILMLFSAVSLGQMFSRHRIAGAVVWYIAEYTIVQFGSSILMSVTLLGVFNSIDRFDSFSSITTPLLCFGLLLTLAGDAVLYFITEYMMKKRLNLE